MINKDRTFCTSYSCMIRTCSRHRCHLPKWYNIPILWEDYEDECNMHVSKDKWKNIEVEEDEDDFI